MANVSIRELRHRAGDVVDRAAKGEQITITKAGDPVATLNPLPETPLPAHVLVERWRGLPPVDADALRADIDEIFDSSL